MGQRHPVPDDADDADAADRLLRRIKGYLWNGNLRDDLRVINDLLDRLECLETGYSGTKALRKAADEFEVYIRSNRWMIPNHAERRRYVNVSPKGSWRAPSTRWWANVLAGVSRCGGRGLVHIPYCRPARESAMGRSGRSSSSGTRDSRPETERVKTSSSLPDCPRVFGTPAVLAVAADMETGVPEVRAHYHDQSSATPCNPAYSRR